METAFQVLIFLVLGAVVVVLLVGVTGMVRRTEFNARYGNRLMQLRVLLQAVAIALIAVFVLVIRH